VTETPLMLKCKAQNTLGREQVERRRCGTPLFKAQNLAPPSEGGGCWLKKILTTALEVHVNGDCCCRRVAFSDSCCQKLVPPRLQKRCSSTIPSSSIVHLYEIERHRVCSCQAPQMPSARGGESGLAKTQKRTYTQTAEKI